MEVKAVQKFVRMSPKKIRFVADVARKMTPQDVVEKLPFIGKKAAQPVVLVVKAALANARNKGIDASNLIFKELQINEGPRLKRGRPVSRGRWHPYKRRMSHVRVVLTTLNDQISNSKLTKGSSEKASRTVEKEESEKVAPIKKAIKSAKQAISKRGGFASKGSV
jgi:large subunit ribosomal protein L22